MKLTFLGADREVTGSCTQLEAAGHRFLIDCGMEQGRDVYENADLPCAPGTYEAPSIPPMRPATSAPSCWRIPPTFRSRRPSGKTARPCAAAPR